jgi:glycosyltransferase involved in cell wall biosynthesis
MAYPKQLLNFPIKILFRRSRHYPVDVLKFLLSVHHESPDLVLFQSFLKVPLFEALLVVVLRHILKVKAALTIHDILPHYPKPWSKFVHSLYYGCFDKLIVHSERSREDLRKMGVKVETQVIPHGVYDLFDLDKLSKAQARTFFPWIRQGDFVVLFFGHLETRKGIFPFLEAAEMLKDKGNFVFLVAGANDLDSAEKRRFEYYRKLDNVIVHDDRVPFEHVQRYFAAADVVALPYLEGTTSGVMKLAIAFKKPVIATDVGDIGEMLASGGGMIVDGEEDLGRKLAEGLTVMKDNFDAFELAAGREAERCSWQKVGALYHEFLLGELTQQVDMPAARGPKEHS